MSSGGSFFLRSSKRLQHLVGSVRLIPCGLSIGGIENIVFCKGSITDTCTSAAEAPRGNSFLMTAFNSLQDVSCCSPDVKATFEM